MARRAPTSRQPARAGRASTSAAASARATRASIHSFARASTGAIECSLSRRRSCSQLGNDVELDHAARGTRLIGAYYQLPPLAGKTVIETYLLDYDVDSPQSDPTAAAHWVAAGARAYRAPKAGAWGYEVETIWQQGR